MQKRKVKYLKAMKSTYYKIKYKSHSYYFLEEDAISSHNVTQIFTKYFLYKLVA